jgi:hypothetical protein
VGGELRIVCDPPLITPIVDLVLSRAEREETDQNAAQLIRSYQSRLGARAPPDRRVRYLHMVLKVVGVGSVGTGAGSS